jgi:hypothetical protein
MALTPWVTRVEGGVNAVSRALARNGPGSRPSRCGASKLSRQTMSPQGCVPRLSPFFEAHGKLGASLAQHRVSIEDLTHEQQKEIVAATDDARASGGPASSARDITVRTERRMECVRGSFRAAPAERESGVALCRTCWKTS